jgi:hypothetical protein
LTLKSAEPGTAEAIAANVTSKVEGWPGYWLLGEPANVAETPELETVRFETPLASFESSQWNCPHHQKPRQYGHVFGLLSLRT